MTRSQWTIVGIFGLSLAAAIFGFAWRYRETRQALEFWGSEAARLIVEADHVVAMKLTSHGDAGDRQALEHGDVSYFVLDQHDIAKAGGITHARNALTSDKSFLWDRQVAGESAWSYAIRFRQGEKRVTVLVDLERRLVCLRGRTKIAVINEKIAEAFAIFLKEQFDPEDEKSNDGAAKL